MISVGPLAVTWYGRPLSQHCGHCHGKSGSGGSRSDTSAPGCAPNQIVLRRSKSMDNAPEGTFAVDIPVIVECGSRFRGNGGNPGVSASKKTVRKVDSLTCNDLTAPPWPIAGS